MLGISRRRDSRRLLPTGARPILLRLAEHREVGVERGAQTVMKGYQTHVTVQPSRYSSFDPDRWWKTHDSVRTEIVEFQKLVLEIALHPMSF
jgi:hypothetical protein